MIEGVFWFTFSALAIGSASLGCYLLFSPRDTLAVRYQNFMLAKTMRPLKDEDFRNTGLIIWGMKIFGIGCLLVSAILMLAVAYLR